MARLHRIDTAFGVIEIVEGDSHLILRSATALHAPRITAFLNTVWSDCDLAVYANGHWLKDAYAAGQHREPGNLED